MTNDEPEAIEPLVIRRDEGARATLVLNRPDKRNALSKEMRIELADLLERSARDPGVRALLITADLAARSRVLVISRTMPSIRLAMIEVR